ncbi:prp 4 c domain-containing protein [Ophiostoma piceae UAMH 11346]|uniref:Prp 4 c domain-containing protein n=1 Tax=Ophiostoma piceae (strain UAMH 11346) TaxID=1262450 RepID=S3BM86_OPHP1|nr:prp 4 c domain-containing protein [Ophiostoma piceae UAMH 11346]
MQFKSSALAFLAVASQVVAEPQPYKAANAIHKMSVRELFGVVRRTGSDGYSPASSLCGLGQTCAEACGAGYATCKSSDDAIHCYNPAAAQICCPDNSGNSCDDGYYCTGSVGGDTVCCPNSQSLTECAAAYSVSGSLTVEVATSSSFSSSIASSSSAVTTSSVAHNTTTSASSTEATTTSHHHTTYKANSTVITSWGTSFTTTSCASGTAPTVAVSTAAAAGSNNFTTTGSPSATTSTVATSAGEFLKPAGVAAAMLAAAFTFLL